MRQATRHRCWLASRSLASCGLLVTASGYIRPMETNPKVTVDVDTPAVALAIGAHPDDIEFGAGATLAKWSADGCVVHHLVCTDGSKGTWDADADIDALVLRRRDEQRAAAAALGATGEVVFLDQIDGELDFSRDLVARVALEIRRLKPTAVLGHDPWKTYRLHPDHRVAGQLTVDAVVAARDPFFFRDQPYPRHRPDWIMLFEAGEVNHLESVNESQLIARAHALLAHESQLETTHFHRLDDPTTAAAGFIDAQRTQLGGIGAQLTTGLGEAFHLISAK